MKKNYLLLLLLSSVIGLAQCPSNLTTYYSSATGTGAALKTQLHNIIKGHTDRGYAGLWVTYQTSDRDIFTGTGYENDNTIYDLYSENPNGTDPYNFTYSTSQCGTYSVEGDCYNREHMIPQSVFSSSAPMVSDAHFIPPTDGKVNGYRSDYPHGLVASVTRTMMNGAKMGSSAIAGYSGPVYEPLDAFKGDIARMYFYFVTRYENTVAGYSYAMFSGNSYPAIDSAFLAMLINWHNSDPVSAFEIARNNAICARQYNRNPYIDHPEWVAAVWGAGSCPADSVNPSVVTGLTLGTTTSTTVSLSWNAATDNTGVTNYDVYVNGVKYASSGGNTFITLTGLTPSTTYSIYVVAKDCQGNISASPSNTVNPTTSTVVAGTATELFFSEYVEGTSNNKALEIINLTGSPVDLSLYSIKRQTNGAGAWSSGLALSGNLDTGSVFFIVNSLTASPCIPASTANLSTAAAEMTFNGNDPIGLFKSGTLIDIIGTFDGGAANFSIDETLRRRSTVTSPTTTFNKATEWDVLASNTCGGLGDAALNTSTFNMNSFSIYPNPSNGTFRIDYDPTIGNIDVEIYSTLGQKVFEKQNVDNHIVTTNGLQSGVYLLKITNESKSTFKKIVIN
ncbi:T9SS type A sorting domain-containing protein [Flavobacterium amnicola]|uniref:T9SS type A sorting domain-containing protein n=1 Tax=Flavobacterium amnicola TaxID=2506422 RepID=A0A4V1N1X9_9FLAO|nr:endonuclease [Flavobacterium amnicola]RXR19068.1 T9SS type A sorting domain-containing protein [Flavobacterium amnicola]